MDGRVLHVSGDCTIVCTTCCVLLRTEIDARMLAPFELLLLPPQSKSKRQTCTMTCSCTQSLGIFMCTFVFNVRLQLLRKIRPAPTMHSRLLMSSELLLQDVRSLKAIFSIECFHQCLIQVLAACSLLVITKWLAARSDPCAVEPICCYAMQWKKERKKDVLLSTRYVTPISLFIRCGHNNIQ